MKPSWTADDVGAFAYRAWQSFWPDRDEDWIQNAWSAMPEEERRHFKAGVNGAVTRLVMDGLLKIGLPWLPVTENSISRYEG